MDNLRASLDIIFSKFTPDFVLDNAFATKNDSAVTNLPEKKFIEYSFSYFNNYSLDEIKNVYGKLNQDWLKSPYKSSIENKSIFNLLTHFNRQVLREIENEPFIEYEHLLRWRALSSSLGEEIFTCSFFAFMDRRSNRLRHFFSWRPVAFTTNNRLKNLLSQGIAENHFHLKGSAPVFDLAWLSLMNNVTDRSKEFNLLKSNIRLSTQPNNSFSNQESDLEILVYKAAYLRQLLFQITNGIILNSQLNDKIKQGELLKYSSNRTDSFEILINLASIQKEINSLKQTCGYKFNFEEHHVVADYAITHNLHNSNFEGSVLLSGERKFLYDCFSKVYSGDKVFSDYVDLFYAYLLTKAIFRNELIQVNNKVGFSNFLQYQDRKELFIPESSIYSSAFLSMAVNDSLKFQNVVKFETRIAPKNCRYKLDSTLNRISDSILKPKIREFKRDLAIDEYLSRFEKAQRKKCNNDHFHVIHFIKKADTFFMNKKSLEVAMITPRHAKLRNEVRSQARAIIYLREGSSKNASKIRGIDAASSEFDTRPEVFAQAFRYLKDHKLSGRYNHLKERIEESKLQATFHAGEDFYDIVDGLRTINEAVVFLQIGHGDRIGHALALGIDVKDFYDFKGHKIMIPKEVLLDNVVWLLAKIRKYGISICPSEVDKLERLYEDLFQEIYSNNIKGTEFDTKHFTHSHFYDAWKLRGDDPYLYLDFSQKDVETLPNVTYWERCRINHFYPANTNIRHSLPIKFLYHQYHFNPNVKSKGKDIKQFNITSDYILLVDAVQKHTQKLFARMNIGIECNPTSNYLIGTFKRYSKHPILNFYNLGLETNTQTTQNCPQLFVSINTDDQGIFGTSLENEYALMAIALEKEKDENGKHKYTPTMIYNWLDNIRRMGIEQSFGRKQNLE